MRDATLLHPRKTFFRNLSGGVQDHAVGIRMNAQRTWDVLLHKPHRKTGPPVGGICYLRSTRFEWRVLENPDDVSFVFNILSHILFCEEELEQFFMGLI